MENYDKVSLVVTGVMSWITAFLITRKIFPKHSFGICKRIVSTIDAVFAVVLCSIFVQDWKCPVCPLASSSSPLQVSIAVIFTLATMCFKPHLCYVTPSSNNLVIIKAVGLGLELVSAFWFYKIAKVVKYKLIKKSTSGTS